MSFEDDSDSSTGGGVMVSSSMPSTLILGKGGGTDGGRGSGRWMVAMLRLNASQSKVGMGGGSGMVIGGIPSMAGVINRTGIADRGGRVSGFAVTG